MLLLVDYCISWTPTLGSGFCSWGPSAIPATRITLSTVKASLQKYLLDKCVATGTYNYVTYKRKRLLDPDEEGHLAQQSCCYRLTSQLSWMKLQSGSNVLKPHTWRLASKWPRYSTKNAAYHPNEFAVSHRINSNSCTVHNMSVVYTVR